MGAFGKHQACLRMHAPVCGVLLLGATKPLQWPCAVLRGMATRGSASRRNNHIVEESAWPAEQGGSSCAMHDMSLCFHSVRQCACATRDGGLSEQKVGMTYQGRKGGS